MGQCNKPVQLSRASVAGLALAPQHCCNGAACVLQVSSHSHELEPQLLASCCEVIMMVGLPGETSSLSWCSKGREVGAALL